MKYQVQYAMLNIQILEIKEQHIKYWPIISIFFFYLIYIFSYVLNTDLLLLKFNLSKNN